MEKDIEISKGVLLKLGFETDDEKIWYFKKNGVIVAPEVVYNSKYFFIQLDGDKYFGIKSGIKIDTLITNPNELIIKTQKDLYDCYKLINVDEYVKWI